MEILEKRRNFEEYAEGFSYSKKETIHKCIGHNCPYHSYHESTMSIEDRIKYANRGSCDYFLLTGRLRSCSVEACEHYNDDFDVKKAKRTKRSEGTHPLPSNRKRLSEEEKRARRNAYMREYNKTHKPNRSAESLAKRKAYQEAYRLKKKIEKQGVIDSDS